MDNEFGFLQEPIKQPGLKYVFIENGNTNYIISGGLDIKTAHQLWEDIYPRIDKPDYSINAEFI